jgi:hypothetical protein
MRKTQDNITSTTKEREERGGERQEGEGRRETGRGGERREEKP